MPAPLAERTANWSKASLRTGAAVAEPRPLTFEDPKDARRGDHGRPARFDLVRAPGHITEPKVSEASFYPNRWDRRGRFSSRPEHAGSHHVKWACRRDR